MRQAKSGQQNGAFVFPSSSAESQPGVFSSPEKDEVVSLSKITYLLIYPNRICIKLVLEIHAYPFLCFAFF